MVDVIDPIPAIGANHTAPSFGDKTDDMKDQYCVYNNCTFEFW